MIELAFGSRKASELRDAIVGDRVALLTHELAVVELRYILCRKLGEEAARVHVEKLLGSGYIVVEDISGLMESAATIKCERSLALPDCFTLALAKRMGVNALFASKEAEIIREMDRTPFTVEIAFLE